MVNNDATNVFLRPILSPKCPNNAEPKGRAKKASAKVDKDKIMATLGFSLLKN